jgi:plastocyanin
MRALVLCAGLALLVCACQTRAPAVVVVTSYNQFSPGALTVTAGTRVVWKNMSTTPHTITSDAWDSGDLYPGQTWSHTFDASGNYLYKDRYAGSNGTVGVITVLTQ